MLINNDSENKKSSTVWINFDFSMKTDYDGLYTFLDTYEAKECGNDFAILHFDYKEDLRDELKQELLKFVTLNERKDRIYCVFKDDTGKTKGGFLFGTRKASPWEGRAKIFDTTIDE